jgi:hypothetical protein
MDKESVIKQNVSLALFMGAIIETGTETGRPIFSFINNVSFCYNVKIQTRDGMYLFYGEELKFHRSWDWLMPVVEKINKRDYVTMYYDECRIHALKIGEFEEIKVIREGEPLIDAVYEAVVKYIEIYNKIEHPEEFL